MDAISLPQSYAKPIEIAIVGGTGLGSLPAPPFKPVALIPAFDTPWGKPSSAISVLEYTPSAASSQSLATSGSIAADAAVAGAQASHASNGVESTATRPLTIAFLARHGASHSIAPHEINNRANVAALKKLGVKSVIGFSAVGSLREEVKPRDFCVAGSVIDWTKGVRPWTFFEKGVVGHISMADPFDTALSSLITKTLARPGVLEGENITAHQKSTIVCIEGPQFATRAESHMFRGLNAVPPVSCINMSAMPECKLFREAEISYALICMSTDYDSWHETREGVSVEMVMSHMAANGANAKRVIGAVLEELAKHENQALVSKSRWQGESRKGVMGLGAAQPEDLDRLTWLFGKQWVGL